MVRATHGCGHGPMEVHDRRQGRADRRLRQDGRQGYYLTALENDTAAGGFFHSDTFVLVDRLNRIRGLYDGTSTAEVDAMLLDAAQLVFED